MKAITFFFAFSFALVFSNPILAQAEMSPDELAIHKVIHEIEDAWAAKDGERYASYFADDHDFIVWFGLYFPKSSQAENAENHQGIFNTVYKNWDVELRVDKMRFLRPELVLVHILGAGHDKGVEVSAFPQVIQSVIMEKTDAGWQVISFHNLDIEYDNILRKKEPSDEEKLAYAKEHYKGWYR